MIGLSEVTVRYPGAARPSLVDASIDVRDGQVTGIAGASGSGKTTLCLALSGLLPRVVRASVDGVLLLDGADATAIPMATLCERVSVLTGAPEAMLSLVADTVFEEVAFGPCNLGVPGDAVVRRVHDALGTVGLGDLAGRDPRRLSTGQTQLVAIASVLAMGARGLVLDEPSAHLDPEASAHLGAVLRELAAHGAAIVVASSDSRNLLTTCDRVAILDDGRLGALGPAMEVLADPAIEAAGIEPLDPSPGHAP